MTPQGDPSAAPYFFAAGAGSDGAGSIGAIAVAESNPDIIYVGTGSADPRSNVTNGDGMYKSTDAGKTWRHAGLPKAGLIGRIRIHPTNPDVAYAAVLGNIFGANPERGVYRTTDGGATWTQALSIGPDTGAIDLADAYFVAQVERSREHASDGEPPEGVVVVEIGDEQLQQIGRAHV